MSPIATKAEQYRHSTPVVNNDLANTTGTARLLEMEPIKRTTVLRQIKDEIAAIKPFDETEAMHCANAANWVDASPNIFRIEKPDKPPKHLVAYFVVIDPDHRAVLLGDHRLAQLWLPSGGHVQPYEHPRQTVRREVQEELNRPAVFLQGNERPLFLTETVTVGLTSGHTDVSLWYLLRGDIHDSLQFERREYSDMAWFSFDEILDSHPAIFDPHMPRFIRKLQKHLG